MYNKITYKNGFKVEFFSFFRQTDENEQYFSAKLIIIRYCCTQNYSLSLKYIESKWLYNYLPPDIVVKFTNFQPQYTIVKISPKLSRKVNILRVLLHMLPMLCNFKYNRECTREG